ncbi:MAG: response regulator [Elusimicrobia bacterium]|nr:response regulator [Elusimicrobiota bacterium]
MDAPPTVLVVDDVSVNRMVAAASLKREGYRVLEAADGVEALATIARESPDVVILDLHMPGMDGEEVLRRLRDGRGPSAPAVVLMTALSEVESAAKAAELGVAAHLPKPFAPQALRDRVRGLLGAAARSGA